jgi:hypothetical protein
MLLFYDFKYILWFLSKIMIFNVVSSIPKLNCAIFGVHYVSVCIGWCHACVVSMLSHKNNHKKMGVLKQVIPTIPKKKN